MKSALWRVSISTTLEAETAVAELLQNRFGQAVSAYTDIETGKTDVCAFVKHLGKTRAAVHAEMRNLLERVASCGLDTGTAGIELRRLKAEDWAESWKRHFKPLLIGGSLLVKPGWSKRRPTRGQEVVILDPGLSFGTGQHPTTGFCLHELVRLSDTERSQSFLDAGCGSGILAIAAAKLGYWPVHAFDFDQDSLRVARRNAVGNRVNTRIRFRHQDAARLGPGEAGRYSVVCANLATDVLVKARSVMTRRLSSGGTLVLAGILASEFHRVRSAYESSGMRLIASKTENEWRSGSFQFSD